MTSRASEYSRYHPNHGRPRALNAQTLPGRSRDGGPKLSSAAPNGTRPDVGPPPLGTGALDDRDNFEKTVRNNRRHPHTLRGAHQNIAACGTTTESFEQLRRLSRWGSAQLAAPTHARHGHRGRPFASLLRLQAERALCGEPCMCYLPPRR